MKRNHKCFSQQFAFAAVCIFSFSRTVNMSCLCFICHVDVLYVFNTWFLNIFLNLVSVVHVFSSVTRLFHNFTPFIDRHLAFVLVLLVCILNKAVPLSGYFDSLCSNSACMQAGSILLCALYIITAIFRFTRSSSLRELDFIKSGLVDAKWSL